MCALGDLIFPATTISRKLPSLGLKWTRRSANVLLLKDLTYLLFLLFYDRFNESVNLFIKQVERVTDRSEVLVNLPSRTSASSIVASFSSKLVSKIYI